MSGLAERHGDLIAGRRRGPAAAVLRAGLGLLSLPYGLVVRGRNLLFDRGWKRVERAGVPVVSVGNLTVGGTGKTPTVEYLARFYRRQERQVAILSRGYGADQGRNDEAMVLEDNLPDVPHLQGADRVALARIAVEELESEILILDDGFQHRRLHRDRDLVLIDATNPWGYGRLLPRGLLREPRAALRRAHLVLLTRCDQAADLDQLGAEVAALAPGIPVAQSVHAPQRLVNGGGTEGDLGLARGRPVAAFCGLGNPAAFRRTAEKLGGDVVLWETFPDHHPYGRADVERLQRWAAALPPDGLVLTTQKDLVKLRVDELGGRPLWAVAIGLEITAGREALEASLAAV
jgi:tetraacyldisaccharide 4'-kinase